ncbi:MAG: hypothetical protein Q9184_006573 [Pyrenodesmia sp. 2 TL-2023]
MQYGYGNPAAVVHPVPTRPIATFVAPEGQAYVEGVHHRAPDLLLGEGKCLGPGGPYEFKDNVQTIKRG